MPLEIPSREPGEELFRVTRAAFILRGSSLNKWCSQQGIAYTWAAQVLRGNRGGARAIALRDDIIKAAELKVCS